MVARAMCRSRAERSGDALVYRRATARIVTTGDALREQLIRDNDVAPDRIDSFRPASMHSASRHATVRPCARDRTFRDGPVVGVIATLRSWKGHRYLLDALPLCAIATRVSSSWGTGRNAQRSKLESMRSICVRA